MRNWKLAIGKALQKLRPVERLPIVEWAEKYILLPAQGDKPGHWRVSETPVLREILEALDDPKVEMVICQKSAQIGWTVSVIAIYMCYRAFYAPYYTAPILAMFPRAKSATDFEAEKLMPMVMASPALHDVFDTRSHSSANKSTWKEFVGGFIKLVGSNAIGDVKSTSAAVRISEEPDDCNINTEGQGDSIQHLIARGKTFSDPNVTKVLIGGTPTIGGLSQIESWMQRSDKRKCMVPCHDCGESHELTIKQFGYDTDENLKHEVYGDVVLDSAFYICPCCGSIWDDEDLNSNIHKHFYEATADFHGVAGFYVSELYSTFKSSSLKSILQRKLYAEHRAKLGEKGPLIEFYNNVLGKVWEGSAESLKAEQLEEKSLEYPIGVVPKNGLMLTAGVDFQHDRIAIIVRAWGRNEESWLVHWDEMHGNVLDPKDSVWGELQQRLTQPWEHESGANLYIRSAGLDASDGNSSENIYRFVRNNKNRLEKLLAIKGSSNDYGRAPIFSVPKKSDVNSRHTKADKWGLPIYIVGTHQIKDIIMSRMVLSGVGPARMHWPSDVNPTYFDHLTAEVKEPKRNKSGQLIKEAYQKKSGRNNEALDCEVYAYHSARGLNIHRMRDNDWDRLEKQLSQVDLFESSEPSSSTSSGGIGDLGASLLGN